MDPKPCAVCGRAITWRKKWARDWEHVRFCSDACRKRRHAVDASLEDDILRLLAERPRGASICPSEVARARTTDEAAWRALMEPIREAARRLVAKGQLVVTQRGQVVDPSRAKGAIRLRRA